MLERRRASASRKGVGGYTLVELLAGMGALVVVFGVLGAVLIEGLDSVARTRAAQRSASGASMGLADAMNDIGDAAIITACTTTSVRYRRPVVGDDGKYLLVPRNETPGPFTFVAPGDEVEVYFTAGEGRLYRALVKRVTVDPADGSVTITELTPPEVEVVAEGLSDVHFTYEGKDPGSTAISPWDVDSVTIHLTSQATEGRRSASDTTTKTVALRNHL